MTDALAGYATEAVMILVVACAVALGVGVVIGTVIQRKRMK